MPTLVDDNPLVLPAGMAGLHMAELPVSSGHDKHTGSTRTGSAPCRTL